MDLLEKLRLSILVRQWRTYADELAEWERGVVRLRSKGMSYSAEGRFMGRNK